ncbi:hypothetical protein BCR39DRAFT_90766 [Naematelia encephala]|uniref:Uncharacterized protein n=1 Tax=Naematelia encephala TaxID=71784 RepID=A0A1Y2B997_9TREE|nr:hypothetical protein BCR39DRAFT_90766 [Naematelia encephala]
MAAAFAKQLEPFEEDLSPPILDSNPYEQSLARSSTTRTAKPTKPTSPIHSANTLQSQIAGEPDSPPIVWKRRTSSSTQRNRPPSVHSVRPASIHSVASNRSPENITAPPSRRHPHLTMTTTRAPLPGQMFMHESPSGSYTDLTDLALPQAPFRRRTGNSSNRSSVHSSQDLSTLTSEELWNLEAAELLQPDLSNPTRRAAETPLETSKRLSRQMDAPDYHGGLPGEVIWPSAPPPEEIYAPPTRTKSSASISSMTKTNRRMSRKTSRQPSLEQAQYPAKAIQVAKSMPASPVNVGPGGLMSSAHSSETSLSSQIIPPNKSFPNLGARPPSAYYSRDFLSSLAPREGGYAIAAQMGNGLGAVGSMSIEERRRSSVYDDSSARSRSAQRPPVAKSAGMGRWSLDGGENFNRPYVTTSAATTTSNLSAPPINSPNPSPPAEDHRKSFLPEGAGPPAAAMIGGSAENTSPSTLSRAQSSPLSQPADLQSSVSVSPTPPPMPAVPAVATTTASVISPKKSKKELAKEAKAAEKVELQRVARERAAAARQEALKKQKEREEAVKAKEEAKRKEKEDKARLKAEKKAKKLKSPSNHSLPFRKDKSATPGPSVPPVPPIPASIPPPVSTSVSDANGAGGEANVPFPRTASSASMPMAPSPPSVAPPRPIHASLPIDQRPKAPPPPVEPKRKIGFLGTIKKRFSSKGGDTRVPASVPRPMLPFGKREPPVTRTDESVGSTRDSTDRTTVSETSIANESPRVADSAPVLAPVERVTSDSPNRLLPAATIEVTPPKADNRSMTPPLTDRVPSTPSPPLQRSVSQQTPSRSPLLSTGSPISRAVSEDRASPASSGRQSVRGPRAMPGRPTSLVSDTNHNDAGFPFQPAPRAAPDPNTPTSGESSRGGGESVITPFTNSEEEVSGASSITSADRGEQQRENSKSSSETVTNNGSSPQLDLPLVPAH